MNRRSFLTRTVASVAALLALPAGAQARFYKALSPLGRVALLSNRGGAAEAETLQRLGFDCLLQPGAGGLGGPSLLLALGDAAADAVQQWMTNQDVRGLILLDPEMDIPALPARPFPPLLVLAANQHAGEILAGALRGEFKHQPGGLAGLTRDDDPVQKAVRRFAMAHSGLPPGGLGGVPFVPSPNWDVRTTKGIVDTVVVHATVINTMEGTQRAFLDDKVRRVSAHYVVDRDGTIVQMVDERVAAWHAGVSELEGRTGVNDFSIGVELINLNDGEDPYPDAQYQALARIIRDARSRFSIPNERIVSHAQIARPLGRKSDPLGFDFGKLLGLL